ncbi:MAG: YfhO family protein, partial [Firmicutes bacterium]|nr:YfhO family protein [Bacillota bacterium]
DILNQITSDVVPFQLNKKKSMGDHLEGTIQTKNDSYFVTSIPYDEGFTIKVDGKEIKYEKVNRAFIGFQLEKGKHQITFDYESPMKRAGIVTSVSGFILFLIILVVDGRRKKNG